MRLTARTTDPPLAAAMDYSAMKLMATTTLAITSIIIVKAFICSIRARF